MDWAEGLKASIETQRRDGVAVSLPKLRVKAWRKDDVFLFIRVQPIRHVVLPLFDFLLVVVLWNVTLGYGYSKAAVEQIHTIVMPKHRGSPNVRLRHNYFTIE